MAPIMNKMAPIMKCVATSRAHHAWRHDTTFRAHHVVHRTSHAPLRAHHVTRTTLCTTSRKTLRVASTTSRITSCTTSHTTWRTTSCARRVALALCVSEDGSVSTYTYASFRSRNETWRSLNTHSVCRAAQADVPYWCLLRQYNVIHDNDNIKP